MVQIHCKFFNHKANSRITRQSGFLAAVFLLVIISGNMAYDQSYYSTQAGPVNSNQKSATFPLVAYTQDHRYEADMTWEPHEIMTDKKIISFFSSITAINIF